MPKRLVLQSIRVARDTVKDVTVVNGVKIEGKKAVTIMPKIGEVFDFTTAEIDYLNEHAPDAIRQPRNDEDDRASTVVIDPSSAVDENGDKVVTTEADKKPDTSGL